MTIGTQQKHHFT